MEKKAFFLFVSLFWVAFVTAQTLNQAQATMNSTNLNKLGSSDMFISYDMSASDIKGSRFYAESFHEGELWTTNNTHYSNELLYRFDGIENSVQIKYKDSGKEAILYRVNVLVLDLIINGQRVTFLKAPQVDPKDEHKLYQVIYFGRGVKVLKLFKKQLKTTTTEGQGFDPSKTETEYKDNSIYYIQVGDKEFAPLMPTKKGLEKAFPFKEKKIAEIFEQGNYKRLLTDVTLAEVLQKLDTTIPATEGAKQN